MRRPQRTFLLIDFLQAPALASHWLEDFTDGVRKWQEKLANNRPLNLSEAPAANLQLLSPLVKL
jgi:hypothetical protein